MRSDLFRNLFHTAVLGALLLAIAPTLAVAMPPDFLAFESGPVRPLALSPSRDLLFAVNTPDNRLEIFNVRAGLRHVGSVPVGLEPVAVAARNNSEVWVVNHLSDSVSVVDVGASPPRVVRTLLVGDAPRDIVFALPATVLADGTALDGRRAFVTTAHRGQHRAHASLAGVRGAGDPQLTTPGVGRADVWVFDTQNLGAGLGGTPLEIVELFGDTPRALAVSPDGGTVYAAVFLSGNGTTTVHEEAVCDGFRPTNTANACPGEFPGAPGGLPGPSTNRSRRQAPEVGLIVRHDAEADAWHDELGRDWSTAVRFDLPDLDVFALDAASLQTRATYAGVGTVLYNLAVHPQTGRLYVSNTEARNEVRFEGPGRFGGSTVQGRLHEARITVLDPPGLDGNRRVLPRHLNKHLDYRRLPAPATAARHSLATPTGMAVSSSGTLYVAAFSSSKIGVIPTRQLETDSFDPTRLSARYIDVRGGGPSGLVLDDVRGRLYVATRFDNGISLIELGDSARETRHVTLHSPEPPVVVNGRPLLYDARFSSSNGEASCASCHIFGDLDGLAWDLGNPDAEVGRSTMPIVLSELAPFFDPPINGTGNVRDFHPMKGPMTTQTLRGMTHSGAMHWRGDRADGIFGRDPFDADLSFRNFAVAFKDLLGRRQRTTNAQMRRFSRFALRLVLPPNPVRGLDNSLSASAQRGRDFYLSDRRSDGAPAPLPGNTCNDCHTLNPAQGHFGTDGRQSFEAETQILKIPHLRNLYEKVGMFGMPDVDFVNTGDNGHQGDQVRGFGYLHDGSIDTIDRFFQAEVFNSDITNTVGFRNDQDRRDMTAFMLAFDTDLAPIVGQQITLSAGSPESVRERIDLLVTRAAAPFTSRILGGRTRECDLVVHAVINSEPRSGLYDPALDTFVTDRDGEAPIPLGDLLSLAESPGQDVTFTCAPPGSGHRMALDRDRDGALDGDERTAGSDPADPTSRPSPAPDITLLPTSRNFSDVAVGTVSAPRRVRVRNDGERALVIGPIRLGGADRTDYLLSEDGCSGTRLPPGAVCELLPRFAPRGEGLKRALIIVPSNDPNEAQVLVTLRGNGVP